jgi:hypothetical protein
MAKNVMGGLYKKEEDKKAGQFKRKRRKRDEENWKYKRWNKWGKNWGYYRRTHEEEKCLYHRAHTE